MYDIIYLSNPDAYHKLQEHYRSKFNKRFKQIYDNNFFSSIILKFVFFHICTYECNFNFNIDFLQYIIVDKPITEISAKESKYLMKFLHTTDVKDIIGTLNQHMSLMSENAKLWLNADETVFRYTFVSLDDIKNGNIPKCYKH